IESSAESGILLAVDADVRAHTVLLINLGPPFRELRAAKGHPAADDRDEAPTRPKTQESLLDVPGPEFGPMAIHAIAGGRERRVHDDRVVALISGKQVVQALGIEC